MEDSTLTKTSTSQDESYPEDLGIDLCYFRSDNDLLAQQEKFVRYFESVPGPVLDIGCGRGVMLRLLRVAGIEGYGIDTFRPALEKCREKGLQVVESDLFSHLEQLPDSSLGGIFCSHVIEHFPPAQTLRLFRESVRVLRPNGTAVFITPNAKDLLVSSEGFWLDLTHVRIYPARLLETLLRELGFRFVKTLEDQDTRYSKVLYKRVAGFIRRLWFWGLISRGDVVAVACK